MVNQVDDVDMDDPVVSEIPVYLNHLQDPPYMCGEIYVLLNTLRPNQRPYGDQGQMTSVELDDENNRLKINYAMNPRAPTYDPDSIYNIRTHSLIAKPTAKDSSTPSYCIGILNEGVMNLVPVSALCNVRPNYDHVDTEAANRKSAAVAASSTQEESGNRSLTGKALHYQQLVRSLRSGNSQGSSNWKRLDCYDYDSVEAGDLLHEHVIVSTTTTTPTSAREQVKQLKLRELEFHEDDQEQYIVKLVSGTWGTDIGGSSSSATPSGESGTAATGGGTTDAFNQLNRFDFGRQVESIMKRFQVAKFEEIVAALPPNTRARYTENDIIGQLESCGICVQGNWVVSSYLSPHKAQLWDTRDAAILLLRAGRDVTVQALATFNNSPREDSEEILRNICLLDIQTNSWKLRIRPDEKFLTDHPDLVKRQESVSNSILARLKVKKEQQISGSTSALSSSSSTTNKAIPSEELALLGSKLSDHMSDIGSMKINEIIHHIQSEASGHYITESVALEVLRVIKAIMVRDRWALESRLKNSDPESERLRAIVISLFRDRDAITKFDILQEFSKTEKRACDLSDHDIRRVIKEFALNERGYWVFNGQMIAERRKSDDKNSLFKTEDLVDS